MTAPLRLLTVLLGFGWACAAQAADPTYFQVHGVKAGEALTAHAAASDKSDVVGELPEGTLVRDLGCQDHEGAKWCNVEAADETQVRGWVEHRYLQASAAPSTEAQLGDASDEVETGEAPCKIKADPSATSCFYAVTRYSGGSSTVVMTYAGGQKRLLEYQNKKFHPQAGNETVATEVKGDHFVVSVNHGAEVFEIPKLAVLGDSN